MSISDDYDPLPGWTPSSTIPNSTYSTPTPTTMNRTSTTALTTILTTLIESSSEYSTAGSPVDTTPSSFLNSTSSDPPGAVPSTHFPYHMLGFTAACAFIIALIGAFGNLLTIAALPLCRSLRNTATAFVVNLAVAELLFCVLILPVSGAQYAHLALYNESLLSDAACVYFTATRYTLTQVELQTILAIALMRAIAVSCMNFYSRVNKPNVVGVYIAIMWIYSLALRIPTIAKEFGHYRFNNITMECDMGIDRASMNARRVLLYLEGVVPVLLIILLYIFIFIMVRQSSQRVARSVTLKRGPLSSQSEATEAPPEEDVNEDEASRGPASPRKLSSASFKSLKRMVSDSNFRQTFVRRSSTLSQKLSTSRRDMRVARTIFIIFLLLMVCSVPVLMVHILDYRVVYKKRFLAMHILYWVQYCVNVFIYVLMNRQYRDAYTDLLSKMFPYWQKHKGFRFPWEAPSHSTRPGQQEHNSSIKSRRGSNKESTPQNNSSDCLSNTQGIYQRCGRLSAIPEGGSTSVGDDALPQDINGHPIVPSMSPTGASEPQNSLNPNFGPTHSRSANSMKSFSSGNKTTSPDDSITEEDKDKSADEALELKERPNSKIEMSTDQQRHSKELDSVSVSSATPLNSNVEENVAEVVQQDSYVSVTGTSLSQPDDATHV